uniref:TonB-dependent receptor domain-containing protein n=1 Tax=Sphingomonas bacterium TaxID=1895847 RepID=UPI0026123F16|nr:TonB-dependent receptor [Sphingomonas bacterium]
MSRISPSWSVQGGVAMASGGLSRLKARPTNKRFIAALIALAAPTAAQASDSPIAITATTLDIALTSLARQTGSDIISTEPGLSRIRVRPIQGRMSVRDALDRLLDGSGYRALAVDGRSFRIVRDQRKAPVIRPVRTRTPLSGDAGTEVVVTASKQRVPLMRYPGTLTTVTGLAGPGGTTVTPDLDSTAQAVPVLQSTALGAGRNKIFIRGVADSSFNGATQSTASIYFGDVQLAYSGPEPDLRLYDMKSVDVLEGPQGTLYGAGAIGGIIRLTPAPVELERVSGAVEGGVSATSHGRPGFDVSGRVNVPIADQLFGIRAIAYRVRDGGYVDDVGQGRANVNRTDTVGGRLAARLDPGGGWQLDTSVLAQRIDGRDASYVEGGAMMRSTAQAQPYFNRFMLGRVVLTKNWDSGLQLLSATGVSDVHSSDLFDATPPGFPVLLVYRTDDARLLLTHETRLSRSSAGGNSWVIGLTLLRNRDVEARVSGFADDPTDIIGVTNVTQSASLFGEGTIAFTHNLSATLGARLTYARVDSEPSTQPTAGSFIRGRSTRRFDPTFAISWHLAPRFAVFGRIQTGYRTGGLAVARGVGRVADFNSDSIIVGEIGFRRLHDGPTGITFSGSASFAHWVDIQADLLNRRGAPYTTNFGNARIFTLEGNVDYVPIAGLHATASFLYTSNTVSGPLADLSLPQNRRLPETPPLAGNVALTYKWSAGADATWNAGGDANYVGRSVLGTGDVLDISQGKYLVLGVHGGWERQGLAVTLGVENLTNRSNNRFAYGNPFTFISRAQATPLRPVTVRLGVSRSW